jgi:8-oxo-dGTP diphosphatase
LWPFQVLNRALGRNLGASAIIPDASRTRVLVLRSRLHGSWGFPGGGVHRGESVEDAVVRECREELGAPVAVEAVSGIYYIKRLDTHVVVFRCSLRNAAIRLGWEHNEFRYVEVSQLLPGERIRATDALDPEGRTRVRSLP